MSKHKQPISLLRLFIDLVAIASPNGSVHAISLETPTATPPADPSYIEQTIRWIARTFIMPRPPPAPDAAVTMVPARGPDVEAAAASVRETVAGGELVPGSNCTTTSAGSNSEGGRHTSWALLLLLLAGLRFRKLLSY